MKDRTKGEAFWRIAWTVLRTILGAIICLIGVAFWLFFLLIVIGMIAIALDKIPSVDESGNIVPPVIGAGILGYYTFGWGWRMMFG